MKLGDQPAFPNVPREVQSGDTRYVWKGVPGMTLRQHYAGVAMQGLLADHKDHEDERRQHRETMEGEKCDEAYTGPARMVHSESCAQAVARLAVEHADALLAELEKKQA